MTKRKFLKLIKPMDRDGKDWSLIPTVDGYECLLFAYTIESEQHWREAKYIYGRVFALTKVYGIPGRPEWSPPTQEIKRIKEEMYKEFLREYNNLTDDVIEFTGP